MTSVRLVYITTPSRTVALKIGKILVQEKLAACANVLPGMISLYTWKGKLCREREHILLLKTTKARLLKVKKRVQALHPYENPCLIALTVDDGLPAFLKWVNSKL